MPERKMFVDSRFAVRPQRLASPLLFRPRSNPARTGPFTAEQASAGRAIYQSTCSSCHLPDLKGTFEAPPLAGANFMNMWRNRPTSDLFTRIRNSMPISNPGSLSDQDAANLVAFILQANGATAGTQALTPETIVPIGAVATGNAPASSAQAAGQTAQPGTTAPSQTASVRLGLTIPGEVKNYVPVTDEMLLKPDPADWLIVRGSYQGWNHSALSQINRDNVKDLRLVWAWNMNDSAAANEPTPLVHNGIIYLVNTDNILQALDGRTGDLIWENRLRPPRSVPGGTGAMRNMAIYQDKVFVETTDAHLFALDARTGQDRVGLDGGRQRQGLRKLQRPDHHSRQSNTRREWMRPLQGAGKRSGLLHQRVRSRDGKIALALQHDRARGRAGRRHLGRSAEHAARRRRNLDHRQLRS